MVLKVTEVSVEIKRQKITAPNIPNYQKLIMARISKIFSKTRRLSKNQI